MSIDPLNPHLELLAAQLHSEGLSKQPGQAGSNFEKVLDDVAIARKTLANSKQSLASLAHLSQMQMLRSLFVDEEDGGDDLFTSVQPLGEFSLLQAPNSQYVDKYYRAQQPAVGVSKLPGRQDIDNIIGQIAEKVSLAPELIHSVVATESAYQADAVSPVGAQGLMQLMPETAKELGVTDSFDVHDNLLGGSRYLKQLLDKYDGDLDHALAAYNWGQGNVDRHGLGKMPLETRNYLAKVKALLKTQKL